VFECAPQIKLRFNAFMPKKAEKYEQIAAF
jgi:hypothetical protein